MSDDVLVPEGDKEEDEVGEFEDVGVRVGV